MWRGSDAEKTVGDDKVAKVLCIDTDTHFGKFVCAHLTDAGYKCILDSRGDRVVKMIEQHNIDIVVAEVMLPDACGFEICRRIRSHPEFFTIPVILMSAMASEDEVQHGLSQGADDYLAKPFDTKVLIQRVGEQLKSAHAAVQPDTTTPVCQALK